MYQPCVVAGSRWNNTAGLQSHNCKFQFVVRNNAKRVTIESESQRRYQDELRGASFNACAVQFRSKRKCVCKCMPLYRFASTSINVAVIIIAGHKELHLRRRHCLLTSSALTSSRVRSCLASPETARRTAITARRLKRWDIMVANWLRLVDEWL